LKLDAFKQKVRNCQPEARAGEIRRGVGKQKGSVRTFAGSRREKKVVARGREKKVIIIHKGEMEQKGRWKGTHPSAVI